MPVHKKKRAFEKGRPKANTKLGAPKVRRVRTRGGNFKFRALRLDHGNYFWQSHHISRKTKILSVVYNATSNELLRTNTLVKNCIITIDATPFKNWFNEKYGILLGVKGQPKSEQNVINYGDRSKRGKKLLNQRNKDNTVEPNVRQQFLSGRLLACVSSRPGQSGRCDGYILEGEELEFYSKKIRK